MADGDLVDRLTAHRTVGGAPREELEWVAAHGHLRRLKVGEILTAKAAGKVDGLFILLSGQLALHVERANARERVYVWHGGDISGILPYSRLTSPPGDSIVERDLELVMVSPADVAQLPHACPGLTAILVHAMVDRARQLTSSELQNEKMATLGKMSAWMAHDLNNPASAIGRSARALRTAASAADDHARALGALALTAEQRSVIDAVCRECLDTPGRAVLSPLQQADRENEVSDWLSDHNCDAADAEALADTALTIPMLDRLAAAVSGAALAVVLRWLASICLTRHLTEDIEEGASRISHLVDSVKNFTRMDRDATVGPVDVVDGLKHTIEIVRPKARGKGASITIEAPAELPPVLGVAGELNQVWMNLLDNAVDAIGDAGAVVIGLASHDDMVVVRVIDNGAGMTADVQKKIFDAFYTTKPVGQGTGVGLEIVKRIVTKHHGVISVESEPGRTEFTVTLPAVGAAEQANA